MTTAGSRSFERIRLARLAVAVGWIERVISNLSAAIRVSILVWGLGARNYGVYVAVLGVVGTANLLDFGLHFAIVNAVSHASGRDERPAIREIVTTGFVVYSLITAAAVLILVPVVFFLPFGRLLHLEPWEIPDVRWVTVIGFAGLLFGMPLKVIPAGLVGLQRQYHVSAYRSVGAIVTLLATSCAAVLWRGHLLPIVLVSSATDLIVTLVFCVWVLRRSSELLLKLELFSRARVRALLGSGLTFFTTGLGGVLKRSFGATIIAHAAGPERAPTFHVALTLFVVGLGFVELLAGSLWPAYGEAWARQDWDWIRRAFSSGTKLSLAFGFLVALLGACFGDQVMAIWTAGLASPSQSLLGWLAVWMAAQAVAAVSAALLNGLDQNRIVMWTTIVDGALSFTGSVLAAEWFGPVGVAAAMAISALGGAAFLFWPGIRRATSGRLGPSIPPAVLGCAAVAAILGGILDATLAGTPVLLHLFAGATVAGLFYLISVWYIAFDPTERGRLRSWTTSWTLAKRPSEST